MTEPKITKQTPGDGRTAAGTGMDREGEGGHRAAEPRTAGTDRDLDRSERSINQGHGHPREERND